MPEGSGASADASRARTTYEQFLAGIISAASEFPGHLGVDVFRPQSASAGEYRTVYRFDTAEHLRAWLDSDEHTAWMERAEPHVIGPMHTSFVTGLETWFTLPGQFGMPPPPYKMALLTWITIFPLITAIVALTGPLLEGLPLAASLAITTALTVPVMTWGGDAAGDPAAARMALSGSPSSDPHAGKPLVTASRAVAPCGLTETCLGV